MTPFFKNYVITILLGLFSLLLNAQHISGCIKDAVTGEAIPNVAVYMAGTSIGVVTSMNGCFEINFRPELNAPLIISALGYEVQSFNKPLETNFSKIKLVPKLNELEPVVINPDPWTRAQKERWFKIIFLGTIPEADECTILNLKDVRLRFNPVSNKLTAVCNVPIIIENKHLGYKISYDLIEFEGIFQSIDLSNMGIKIDGIEFKGLSYKHESAFVAGSAFFTELKSKRPKERQRNINRKNMYNKSVLKFCRSLISNSLEKEGYILYRKGFLVKIDKHIRVKNNNNFFTIEFRESKYGVNDVHGNESAILLEDQRIFIDAYGNNLSPKSISFIGYFSKMQIAGMLPLDYGLEL